MFKKILISFGGYFIGLALGFLALFFLSRQPEKIHSPISETAKFLGIQKNQVVGFLPYWLLDKADKDYGKYLTQLSYFGFRIGDDGKILKLLNDREEEPGWNAFRTGRADKFLQDAKNNNVGLSVTVADGDEDSIAALISDPVNHAQNLITDIAPVMKKYGFTDLNLDIESVKEASAEARNNFTAFVREVKKGVDRENLGTLTVDVSPIVLIKKYLIDLDRVEKSSDFIVLMTYDYHYAGSSVTGPVSPIGGAELDAEFDSQTAIDLAVNKYGPEKIFLGAPLYGYEWETLGRNTRSPVIPGTGIIASSSRVEELLAKCTDCQVNTDKNAGEKYLVFPDQETGTYHQIDYPDEESLKLKTQLAEKYKLAGIALWALGYEGNNILNPLEKFKN